MNMTETTIATLIVLALASTTLFIGSKVSTQVSEHAKFIEAVADPNMEAKALEQIARQQVDRRQAAIEQAN